MYFSWLWLGHDGFSLRRGIFFACPIGHSYRTVFGSVRVNFVCQLPRWWWRQWSHPDSDTNPSAYISIFPNKSQNSWRTGFIIFNLQILLTIPSITMATRLAAMATSGWQLSYQPWSVTSWSGATLVRWNFRDATRRRRVPFFCCVATSDSFSVPSLIVWPSLIKRFIDWV